MATPKTINVGASSRVTAAVALRLAERASFEADFGLDGDVVTQTQLDNAARAVSLIRRDGDKALILSARAARATVLAQIAAEQKTPASDPVEP